MFLTSVQKNTLVRDKATEGVFTRQSCSFRCVKPSNDEDEDANDTDYDDDDDDKSRTHTQYILKY